MSRFGNEAAAPEPVGDDVRVLFGHVLLHHWVRDAEEVVDVFRTGNPRNCSRQPPRKRVHIHSVPEAPLMIPQRLYPTVVHHLK